MDFESQSGGWNRTDPRPESFMPNLPPVSFFYTCSHCPLSLCLLSGVGKSTLVLLTISLCLLSQFRCTAPSSLMSPCLSLSLMKGTQSRRDAALLPSCFVETHFPPNLRLLTVQTQDVIIRQAKFEIDVEVSLPQTAKNTKLCREIFKIDITM